MIAQVYNQNFGYSVACDGYWSAVGNPISFRYDPLTASLARTGSVDIYRYNINTDLHDLRYRLYRPLTAVEELILSTEYNNSSTIPTTGPVWLLKTEPTGSVPVTADKMLLVDVGNYFTSSEDGYGYTVDMRDTLLAVGCPYFESTFTFTTGSIRVSGSVDSGSSYVDLFDLSALDVDPYAKRAQPVLYSTSSIGGYVYLTVNVIPNQGFSYILFQTLNLVISGSQWQNISLVPVPFNAGGLYQVPTGLQPSQFVNYQARISGVVNTNPYITTIYTPNTALTNSFGYSLSLNDEWLAVGSPHESGSKGAVFMFRKLANNNYSWSFVQTLPTPPDIMPGDNFGSDIGMNKMSSSYSWSMVVGSQKLSQSHAYVYQFDGTKWYNIHTLSPDSSSIYPLTFYPTKPIVVGYPNTQDLFGYSVAMYGESIIVGAPHDRAIQEYSGSSEYHQGAVYFFEKCADQIHYYVVRKSYGNEKIMKNNQLGWSVDMHNNFAVAGAIKLNALSSSICYLRGSLFQDHFCGDTTEEALNGQFVLYNKTTGSIPTPFTSNTDWDITNIYQVKKRFLSPYRVYGWDTSICHQFITIGAPMLISGSGIIMDLNATTGSFTGSLSVIGDLCGKAYIYNLKNLRPNFYVGNVFYRNGKIVVMTSGSKFEGLQLSNIVGSEYEYELDFKSKQTVYEKQVVCPVEIGEFNVSTNPTAVVLPDAEFDINGNGMFDFQDADVLLRYMAYKNTEGSGQPDTDWSSSIVDTSTDEEPSVYNMYAGQYQGTDALWTSSYSNINNNVSPDLDFNNDNKIDNLDMNILWKYFIYRLTKKNYETWITPSSKNKYLSSILDYLNSKTLRTAPPLINPTFTQYHVSSTADPTGSYLAPTVTSVGLYDGCDLVAIAKLGSPIKITPDFPINFVVKMDF